MSDEAEELQLIAERDRLEKAIQEIHIALGGDGEWTRHMPAQPLPHSGDLAADSLFLVRELVRHNKVLLAACKVALPQLDYERVPDEVYLAVHDAIEECE